MKAKLTKHAVERYIERCEPSMGLTDAREWLEMAMETATRLPDVRSGSRWLLADGARLVVRLNPTGPNVCVTVLPRVPEPTPVPVKKAPPHQVAKARRTAMLPVNCGKWFREEGYRLNMVFQAA